MTWDVEIVTLENDDDGVFVSWSGDFFFEAADASSGGFWHFFGILRIILWLKR